MVSKSAHVAIRNLIQRLGGLCLMLVVANLMCPAQGAKDRQPSRPTSAESKKASRLSAHEEAQVEIRNQLRVLRAYTLTRTVDSIKKIEEPALRISARNEILKYLTMEKAPSDEDKALTTNIAREALADFTDHSDEIMSSLAEFLFSNFGAWVRKYQPSLAEKLETIENTETKGRESQSIRAQLELSGGDTLAAHRLTQDLEKGQDMPVLVLYLLELIRLNSKEVEPLLSKLVEVAARGQLSFETLFSVSDVYLRPQTPVALRRRFATMVIARTQPSNFGSARIPQSAYYLLTKLLPAIEQLTPELYSQAVNQGLVIYGTFSAAQVAVEERNQRLNESPFGIEGLVTEAEETESKSRRNELLAEAAQLALQSEKFELSLDILAKLDLKMADAPAISWSHWHDQFIKEFVRTVLLAKRIELAEKGAGLAVASLERVEALLMVRQYCGEAHDQILAQRMLMEARRAAGATTNYIERAKAFLLIGMSCDQADASQKGELLESAVKALNSVSMRKRDDNDQQAYQRSVWKLNGVEYQVTKGFRSLAKDDEEGALLLVEKIDKPESKSFALLGVLHGMSERLHSRSVRLISPAENSAP